MLFSLVGHMSALNKRRVYLEEREKGSWIGRLHPLVMQMEYQSIFSRSGITANQSLKRASLL